MSRPAILLQVARFTYPGYEFWTTQDGQVLGSLGDDLIHFDLENQVHRNALFMKLRQPEHGGWTIQKMKNDWRATNNQGGVAGTLRDPDLLQLVRMLRA